jgi:glycosyltransferase involved in cell wall biosynthesis
VSKAKTRVVVLRGTAANLWDLRPWERLGPDFETTVLVPPNNEFDLSGLHVRTARIETLGGRLPRGRAGRLATRAIGERYLGLEPQLAGADIVHAAELGYWFTAQAARLRARLGFRLVATVWETLPFGRAYRNLRTRPYRNLVLAATDRFLATTERAREALLLEGVMPERIEVAPPGIDVDRFAMARAAAPTGKGHLLLSIGRLVWEKGHQDVIRALALLRRHRETRVRLLIVGVGPEERRLRAVARDLGVAELVEFRGWIANEDLPALYAQASCLVLGSLPTPYWEEQFGMVLVEAMAANTAIVAASSGAIPEVVGSSGTLYAPGDYIGLADALAAHVLTRGPAARVAPEPERLSRYSAGAAAERLRAVYEELR